MEIDNELKEILISSSFSAMPELQQLLLQGLRLK